MTAHQAVHRVATMAWVRGVSRSGYYAWRKRPLPPRARADVELSAHIHAVHRGSRGSYGAPRIHADLAAQGIHVGCTRVARLMRCAGPQGVSRRTQCRTTVRDDTARPAPDLADRQFTTAAPDRLWVADITYVPTGAGFLYLAVVVDAWSRRVIGWAMASHVWTELVVAALEMALAQRRPTDGVRAARSVPLPDARRRAPGRLRLHRRLVQPAPPPFRPRVPVPAKLREDPCERQSLGALRSNDRPGRRYLTIPLRDGTVTLPKAVYSPPNRGNST